MIGADWIILGVIFCLILCSAFFSGSETALTAVSKARMHQQEKGGNGSAGIVNRLIADRNRLIAALLIGNNLVNILASALATSVFLKLFGEAGIALATLVMTLIVVIFAEIMPKSWALTSADRFSLAVAPIVNLVVLIVSPVAMAILFFVKLILKLFGVKLDETGDMLSAHEELRGTFEVFHQEGSVVKDDRDRLGGVLDLHELELSDVMIHRTNMVMIDIDQKRDEIMRQVLASPYTRIPLWKDSADNIIGILHSKDVLRAIGGMGSNMEGPTGKSASGQKNFTDIDITKIAAKPWFVPETTSLRVQLNAFLKNSAHIALVVDEYGEVLGLVTLEDILEEIVGNIADEHDIEVSGVVTEPDGSILVDGTVPIRDLNRALDWDLPDDEATTIAGLVIHAAQTIPEEKQAFTFFGKRFVVLAREKNRITKLRIRQLAG